MALRIRKYPNSLKKKIIDFLYDEGILDFKDIWPIRYDHLNDGSPICKSCGWTISSCVCESNRILEGLNDIFNAHRS